MAGWPFLHAVISVKYVWYIHCHRHYSHDKWKSLDVASVDFNIEIYIITKQLQYRHLFFTLYVKVGIISCLVCHTQIVMKILWIHAVWVSCKTSLHLLEIQHVKKCMTFTYKYISAVITCLNNEMNSEYDY